jgi:hypothetical protein
MLHRRAVEYAESGNIFFKPFAVLCFRSESRLKFPPRGAGNDFSKTTLCELSVSAVNVPDR